MLIGDNEVFCVACQSKIRLIPPCFLSVSKKYSIKVFALGEYIEPLRSLILRKKCFDRLAGQQLAALIFKMMSIGDQSFDYIVPIPLHWTRYARRGFNQSHEMACVLSKKLNVPVLHLLKRVRRTSYQSSLSYDLRQENVSGVFDICFKYRDIYLSIVHDRNILFVDDLCTTGATLKNAARALFVGCPKSVSAVVACRVL